MKPIKLEMDNFGPYRHVLIDFTKLAASPLFLISGKTGAGKTTIFDGMCYALYGKTTSHDRDANALHADFARHDLCKVSLTFEHDGQTYQVSRQPAQQVHGRGHKLVDRAAKVSLIYPLESDQPQEITKITAANQFIEQLLNLDANQFSQIVLLPQGRFREFLASDSNAKEALLRDLFHTQLYSDWQQQIKGLLAGQQDQQKDLQTSLQTLQHRVEEVDADQPLSDWLGSVDRLLAGRQATIDQHQQQLQHQDHQVKQLNDRYQAAKELDKQLHDLDKVQAQLQELAQRRQEIDHLHQQIDHLNWFSQHQEGYLDWQRGRGEIQELLHQLQTAGEAAVNAQKKQAVAQQDLDDLQAQSALMEKHEQELAALQERLPRYQAREKLLQSVKQDQEEKNKSAAKLAQVNQTLQQHQDDLKKGQQAIEKLNQTLTGKVQVVQERNDWQSAHELWEKWQDEQKQQATGQQQIKELQTRNQVRQDAVKQARQAYEDLQDMQVQGQIMALVKKLHKGQACPVCGSTSHPHPAHMEDVKPVDTDNLKAAANRLTQASRQQATAETQLQKAKEQAAKLESQLKQDWHDLQAKLPDASEQPAQFLQAWGQRLTAKEKHLADAQARLQKLQEQLPKWQAEVEQGQLDLQRWQQADQQARVKLAESQASLKSQSQGLDSSLTYPEAETKLQQGRQRLSQYKDQSTKAQQHLQAAREKLAAAKQNQQQLSQQYDQRQKQQTKLHDNLNKQLAAYDPQLQWEFWASAAQKLADLPKLQKRSNDYHAQKVNLQQRERELQTQTANQKAPALDKIAQELKKAEDEQATMQKVTGRLQEQLDQLQSDRQAVAKLGKQQAALLDRMKELQTLYDVVAGHTDNKVSLERYLLQSYFAEVLNAANPRLQSLSDGRYYFQLNAGPGHGSGSKWSGLEVNIYDDAAGQLRSARTLSGGESFIASLSLALALSEVVQEHHGGVHIEALFIDEGFGSLDQEALDHALKALQSIQGGRMVGIISHVSELEERLPNQLHVISEHGVSRVEYQLDLPVN